VAYYYNFSNLFCHKKQEIQVENKIYAMEILNNG